jgi:hypothetical protein
MMTGTTGREAFVLPGAEPKTTSVAEGSGASAAAAGRLAPAAGGAGAPLLR